jgi:hypothetical protein
MAVSASMFFLAQVSLYDEVKPYRLKYAPPAGLPESNFQVERHEISIFDARTQSPRLDLHKDGFEFKTFKSAMSYEDFDDDQTIKQVYLKEVADGLKLSLKASRVQIFEHLVAKTQGPTPKCNGLTLEDPESKFQLSPSSSRAMASYTTYNCCPCW